MIIGISALVILTGIFFTILVYTKQTIQKPSEVINLNNGYILPNSVENIFEKVPIPAKRKKNIYIYFHLRHWQSNKIFSNILGVKHQRKLDRYECKTVLLRMALFIWSSYDGCADTDNPKTDACGNIYSYKIKKIAQQEHGDGMMV